MPGPKRCASGGCVVPHCRQEQLYHPEFYNRLSGRGQATLKSPKNGANRSGIVLQISNDKLIKPEITAPADLTVNEGWYGIIWSLLEKDAACKA